VAWRDLTHIALSHFHYDHFGDLAAVLLALKHAYDPPRTQPLTLLGPVGLVDLVSGLARAVGDHVVDPGFEVRVVEVTRERPLVDPSAGFELSCHPTPHSPESLAYRLDGDGWALGYTGDTGPSEAVTAFLTGVDVLVAECCFPDEAARDGHLTPATLADLALEADPDLLVVVHVGPGHTPEDVARQVSRRHDGAVVAATDGLRIRWGPDGPFVDPTVGPI